MTYQRPDVGELLVSGDEDRLHEKLVAALRIWRWVFLHGLEENWAHTLVCCGPVGARMEGMHTLNFDIFPRLDASAVRPHTVSKPVISGCGERYRGRRTAWEPSFSPSICQLRVQIPHDLTEVHGVVRLP